MGGNFSRDSQQRDRTKDENECRDFDADKATVVAARTLRVDVQRMVDWPAKQEAGNEQDAQRDEKDPASARIHASDATALPVDAQAFTALIVRIETLLSIAIPS